MARSLWPSGFTLIECMVAMGILLVGAVGLVSLHAMGARMNDDARVMTRATAIAQDLVSQMQTWSYTDVRLADGNPGNNADYADSAGVFQGEVDGTAFDHQESELTGASWLGIPGATVQALGFQRYWNVADVDLDEYGNATAHRVAVIVRWDKNGGRRIVLVTVIRNPAAT